MFNATAHAPSWAVIENRSVRSSARCRRPERRSDDGRTILEGIRTGLKLCPDLQLLVELSGLEPLTSCMPSGGSTSTRVHPRRSPSSRVPASSPASAPVAVLSCCTHRHLLPSRSEPDIGRTRQRATKLQRAVAAIFLYPFRVRVLLFCMGRCVRFDSYVLAVDHWRDVLAVQPAPSGVGVSPSADRRLAGVSGEASYWPPGSAAG
jgi:hypothetical protein